LNKVFRGRVWKFGDDINTDLIITGKRLTCRDSRELASAAFENIRPDFGKNVKEGDMIFGGKNFGCGSSRESAPASLKAAGVAIIVADSFSRIFYRNSVNLGLPVIECPGISSQVEDGDTAEVHLDCGEIRLASGRTLSFRQIPDHVRRILDAGGLVNKVREELGLATR
jgi:3-isopropylmalate/(R)-2-methylmalate dehydratase small subunit